MRKLPRRRPLFPLFQREPGPVTVTVPFRADSHSDGAAVAAHGPAVLDCKRARALAANHFVQLEPAPVTVTVPIPPGSSPTILAPAHSTLARAWVTRRLPPARSLHRAHIWRRLRNAQLQSHGDRRVSCRPRERHSARPCRRILVARRRQDCARRNASQAHEIGIGDETGGLIKARAACDSAWASSQGVANHEPELSTPQRTIRPAGGHARPMAAPRFADEDLSLLRGRQLRLAEGGGFEPPIDLRLRQFSRLLQSTALPPSGAFIVPSRHPPQS